MSSPSIPATSELDLLQFDETLPSSDHNDALEAAELLREETILKNNKERKVIQHRSWSVKEAFRSEGDDPQVTPSRSNHSQAPPSSPPILFSKMPASSPIAYPPSSSPPQKKRPARRQSPLKEQNAVKRNRPRNMGGFLEDDSDEDEEPARKKRMQSPQLPTRRDENKKSSREPEDLEMEDVMMADQEDEDELEALHSMENPVASPKLSGSIFAKFKKRPTPTVEIEEGSSSDAKEAPRTSIFAKFKPRPRPVVETEDEESDAKEPPRTSIFTKSKKKPAKDDGGAPEISQDRDSGFVSLLDDTDSFSTEYPTISSLLRSRMSTGTELRTCAGKSFPIQIRKKTNVETFEQMVAARSTTKVGRAKKSFYGIDIQQLIEEAKLETAESKENAAKAQKAPEIPLPSVEKSSTKPKKTLMWTEKYRAKKFTDLVGDDRTHRQVLKWLKAWDPIVFPRAGAQKPKSAPKKFGAEEEVEKAHRKILLLTGPPGLGKTTLAHVCARQAGYEVMEINASDDRSSNVVKGRIRDSVGTESVKAVTGSKGGKSARPVCVVVDEVDGVVSGSSGSGGEGGFIKALIDLLMIDQKNSSTAGITSTSSKKKKDKDKFKLMRPIILICNDLYHPSLRPIRQASFAEVIHIRPPPLDAVIARMSSVFAREGIEADPDGVRRLCEATWGMNAGAKQSGREASGTGEGDLRGILVVGESVARQLKFSPTKTRLSRKWVEQNMISTLSSSGSGARGIGRGGTKEIVQRIFLEGGGFPKPSFAVPTGKALKTRLNEQPKAKLGVAEIGLKAAVGRLQEMIETSGEIDRVLTDVFASYPEQNFQDDTYLSKPDKAYEWFSFHDACSSRVYSNQEWELMPYLSQPILACHTLFSHAARHQNWTDTSRTKPDNETETPPTPFSGPLADRDARESEKANRALLTTIQSSLSTTLTRSFRAPSSLSTELLPYVTRMLTPAVKPVIVGGSGGGMSIASVRKESERNMVRRAVDVMNEIGVVFEKGKLEDDSAGFSAPKMVEWVYRMEPPLDDLTVFETSNEFGKGKAQGGSRYAVRQVLDQEYRKSVLVRENAARQNRYQAGGSGEKDLESESRPNSSHGKETQQTETRKGGRLKAHVIQEETRVVQKKDFFGRAVVEKEGKKGKGGKGRTRDEDKVWVSYHEGFSNAVRRPVRVEDILRGL